MHNLRHHHLKYQYWMYHVVSFRSRNSISNYPSWTSPFYVPIDQTLLSWKKKKKKNIPDSLQATKFQYWQSRPGTTLWWNVNSTSPAQHSRARVNELTMISTCSFWVSKLCVPRSCGITDIVSLTVFFSFLRKSSSSLESLVITWRSRARALWWPRRTLSLALFHHPVEVARCKSNRLISISQLTPCCCYRANSDPHRARWRRRRTLQLSWRHLDEPSRRRAERGTRVLL